MLTLNPKIVLAASLVLLVGAFATGASLGWPTPVLFVAGAILGVTLSAGSVVFGRSKRGRQYLARRSAEQPKSGRPKTLADMVRGATTPPKDKG